MGTGSTSVAKEVAEVQRLLENSGLKYTMHSAGTTVGTFSFFWTLSLSGIAVGRTHGLVTGYVELPSPEARDGIAWLVDRKGCKRHMG